MNMKLVNEAAPVPSWTTNGIVTRVIDGDTVDVQVTRTIRVRMVDCWAPESHADSRLPVAERAAEKQRGQDSRLNLAGLAEGQAVIVQIPTSAGGDVAEVFTFGRALGRVWLESDPGESLNAKQVRGGFAELVKPGKLSRTT